MIQYGLISGVDARTLEKTIDLVEDGSIYILEVGVYSGETGDGMRQYAKSKGKYVYLTGVDNDKYREPVRFRYDEMIIGDADEVAHRIKDETQDIVFLDACHCFAHVVSNFFNYAPKVKQGGFICFHDTGKHIKKFKDFQHGDRASADAYISVRKALLSIGLFEYEEGGVIKWGGYDEWGENGNARIKNWVLIFDEADENDAAGGICVFKKMY